MDNEPAMYKRLFRYSIRLYILLMAAAVTLLVFHVMDAFSQPIHAMTYEQQQAEYEKLLPRAKGSDRLAQRTIAWMYENGYGVPLDMEKAVEWYLKSAENGDPVAQYELGRIYDREDLFYNEAYVSYLYSAVRWYRKSAKQGFFKATRRLKEMEAAGLYNPEDYEEREENG